MPKKITAFYCKECGYESAKWLGQCPGCKAWNSFLEAPKAVRKENGPKSVSGFGPARSYTMDEVSMEESRRISTGMAEFDRVLGGGIVPGSLVLIGGDPGIGKSTILLEILRNLAAKGHKVLYISGEESLQQIKMRAIRLKAEGSAVRMASETDLDTVEQLISEEKPLVAVIDSIQTMFRENVDSAPGSVTQVRESTNVLLTIAKRERIAIFIVGHVTKEGTVAGSRMLEHMVDTVLYFEGDRFQSYRVIRAVKNRFGATNEVGVFEMTGEGLREVPNPADYMLTGRPLEASGSAVTCVLEGTRPMLLEIQSLVTKTSFGLPRRTAVGIDLNRLNLLLAVMEKRSGLQALTESDVYVNLTGGMKVTEPAMDLAIVMSVASGLFDVPIDEHTLAFGEVGLTGELRGASQAEQRVKEAVKLGYQRIIFPAANARGIGKELRKYCMPVHSIREAIAIVSQQK
ncbi:MAG: DNA repair protein RadA [Lachnospiraceae bacterium]|nr:DNA repair protein RadA [Lachnospiraceae bacterium]